MATQAKRVSKTVHVSLSSITPHVDDLSAAAKGAEVNEGMKRVAEESGCRYICNHDNFLCCNGDANMELVPIDGLQLSNLGTERLKKTLKLNDTACSRIGRHRTGQQASQQAISNQPAATQYQTLKACTGPPGGKARCTIKEFLSAILAAFSGVPSHKWLRFGRSRSPLGCSIRYELGSLHFSMTIAVVHMLFGSLNMTCYPTISSGISFVWEPWAPFFKFCLSSSLSMIVPWTSCPFVMLTGALLLAFLLLKSPIGLGKMPLRGVVCRHNRATVWN